MTEFLDGPKGRIAYNRIDGQGPGVVFLGGFRSDMQGTKAVFLEEWARAGGRAFLRFDYSGHGESDGSFEAGCIGDWLADAAVAIDALTEGPQVLVGSSMGGCALVSQVCASSSEPKCIGGKLCPETVKAPAAELTRRSPTAWVEAAA